MNNAVIADLTEKDDCRARVLAERIVAESRESAVWFGMLADFAALLDHPKSLVRNRAIAILAANARWDDGGCFDAILPLLLRHITDEKPITCRCCIKALAELGRAKPCYIAQILAAFAAADLSGYKDSMRRLIEQDMAEAARILREIS